MNFIFLILIVLAFLVSYTATPFIIQSANENNWLDKPGGRKQHRTPTPSLGGLAIFGSFWLVLLSFALIKGFTLEILPLLICSLILFFVGLKDDLSEISAFKKLFVQLGIATVLYEFELCRLDSLYGLFGYYELHPSLNFIFSVLTTALIINAYNLIDGINGLSGSLTIMSSLIFGFFFLQYNMTDWAFMAFALSAATFGFLQFNFGNASIFMGDNGSTFIGLIQAIFFYQLLHIDYPATNIFPIALSLISIPVFDLLRVFCFRITQKRGPFSPDRSHIHHILLRVFDKAETVVFSVLALNLLLITVATTFSSLMPALLSVCLSVVLIWGFPLAGKKIKLQLEINSQSQ